MAETNGTLVAQKAQLAELNRLLFGIKSERVRVRVPSIISEIRKATGEKSRPARHGESGQAQRAKNAAHRRELPTEDAPVLDVPTSQQECPFCGRHGDFVLLGYEESYEYDYVPARLLRRRYKRMTRACRCGQCVITAPAPRRVRDASHYGAGFYAHVVVSKCADVMPFNRLAARFQREGVPLCRSTLCDLFHQSAELLEPLYHRLIQLVAQDPYVNADETPLRVRDKGACRRGYIWTFIGSNITTYVFSPNRSGETPMRVLADTGGLLQVDGFTGYNQVCLPDGRIRAGCLAHCRRKFYAALETAYEPARKVLDLIRDVYLVEYEAAKRNILGTELHGALRRKKSAAIMDQLKTLINQEKPLHLPKSPFGQALTYATHQWDALTKFLVDPRIRLDNNVAEQRLRKLALGRRNFLFVGHDAAGQNLAVLQSLVATCEACGVNPQRYLADVLMRIQTHPASQLDDLLPMHWQQPQV